jgi:hypothetical protein
MAGLGVFFYQDLAAWEAEGGVRRMPVAGWIAYAIGGKWAIAGIALFMSAFFLVAAIAASVRPKKRR